ncbi:hypothetical protein H5410_008876 [Solanum commersonii]|uniref:Protein DETOXIFICATION n=1 Tax=Solanum commersonii TaxID=4109 RepID=A0A9J6AHW4_SOLCO|nr:hypothetical protein H5410_008876 [Solanum commersonii]
MAESMEEQLLENGENRKWIITETYCEELKKLSYIAAPMVAVSVLQYLLQVVSMMMVGHLDQISLSSVSIATSITNVTGFSLLSGLVGGLETLSGQAYGANQWQKVGTYTYSAVISLIIVCIPISILWLFMDKLLILMGQDPVISFEAYKFSLWLTPALFGSAILRPLLRYLLIQSLILPMLVSAFLSLCLHISLSWFFIFHLRLGKSGAAIAFCFSIWTFVALLVVYISRSNSCERTRTPLNRDAFLAIGKFFRYAIPSALMVCLTISALHFALPYGLGTGVSTRVSNELGSGNPQKALVAVRVAMFLAVSETVVASIVIFLCRGVLGKAYSNDEQVVDYVAAITPFLCLTLITDSLQAVICGKGSGWQIIGAYVNLGAFYLVGIPVAAVLCFLVNLKAKGLWIGLLAGSAIQAIKSSSVEVKTSRTIMEEELPQSLKLEKKWQISWDALSQELKKTSQIVAPMVAVTVFQYLLQVVSIIMVGHLGQLALSSVAIATSLTNVTGFSLLSGLVGGLETLCGQAYGAKQYHKLSTYTYTAIISLFLVCLPICVLWFFMDKLLILIGQDHEISIEARRYAIWAIPALFGGAISKPLVRYLQTQSLILPMLLSSLAVLCLHLPISWGFIFKLELGNIGAAIAFSVSTWLYVLFLALHVSFSSSCEKTRTPFSMDVFLGIKEFFRLAVPSGVMVCLKWWSLEVLTLLSGLLPNPTLEASVLTISTLHFTIPYGFGAAASTRVSNELGAGNPQRARMAVQVVMILAVIETVVLSTSMFGSRHILGRAFSNEKQVVDYIAAMTPLLCLSIITDSLQAVISAIPLALVLGFTLHMKAKGLWIGIVVGSTIQSIILSIVTCFTDWEKQILCAPNQICRRDVLY